LPFGQLLMLAISLAMIVYHLVSSQYLIFGQWEHQTIHLIFLLTLSFLGLVQKSSRLWVKFAMGLCILLSLAACTYIFVNVDNLEMTFGFPEPEAVRVGIVLIALVFLSTILNWGWALPVVAGAFVAYFLWGHHLGGALYHAEFTLTTSCLSLRGPVRDLRHVPVHLANRFPLRHLRGLLSTFKVNGLFHGAGQDRARCCAAARAHRGHLQFPGGHGFRRAGGQVAITGAFTIPYMKNVGTPPRRRGHRGWLHGRPDHAPGHGSGGLLMATFIGEPYSVVMLAAIVRPCLLLSVTWACSFWPRPRTSPWSRNR
jgi:TRAP-type uncharacterized transport system fused permease subunit